MPSAGAGQQQIQRRRIGLQVAPAEPPGLKACTEKPFQAHLLHPLGCARLCARHEVEQAARRLDHADRGQRACGCARRSSARAERPSRPREYPAPALRSPRRLHAPRRGSRRYPLRRPTTFSAGKRSCTARVAASLMDFGGAQHEHPRAAALRLLVDGVEQVGRRHALRQRHLAFQTRDEDMRHAVGMDSIRLQEQLAQLRIECAGMSDLAVGRGEERGIAPVSRDDATLRRP